MVRAMVELQYLTGMRVSEVRLMRTGEIDRRGNVWRYTQKHPPTVSEVRMWWSRPNSGRELRLSSARFNGRLRSGLSGAASC